MRDCDDSTLRSSGSISSTLQALAAGEASSDAINPTAVQTYRDKRWVTRPRPHIDRLACIWLIRRFINPDAIIRYANTPGADEVAFDMRDGAFSHRENLCTFETMVVAFGLEEPNLHLMGEIVHEIDLRDGRHSHPETAVIEAVLKGWLLMGLSHQELEAHSVALFEGRYTAFSRGGLHKPSGNKT